MATTDPQHARSVLRAVLEDVAADNEVPVRTTDAINTVVAACSLVRALGTEGMVHTSPSPLDEPEFLDASAELTVAVALTVNDAVRTTLSGDELDWVPMAIIALFAAWRCPTQFDTAIGDQEAIGDAASEREQLVRLRDAVDSLGDSVVDHAAALLMGDLSISSVTH